MFIIYTQIYRHVTPLTRQPTTIFQIDILSMLGLQILITVYQEVATANINRGVVMTGNI